MKLNNKGFTLIEVIAVVVILTVIGAIMMPTVGKLIEDNKEDNYEAMKQSILSAAKIYISDNKYELSIGSSCTSNTGTKTVSGTSVGVSSEGKLYITTLVNSGDLKANGNGEIINPKNNTKLNLATSYVTVKYSCATKDFIFGDPVLKY